MLIDFLKSIGLSVQIIYLMLMDVTEESCLPSYPSEVKTTIGNIAT